MFVINLPFQMEEIQGEAGAEPRPQLSGVVAFTRSSKGEHSENLFLVGEEIVIRVLFYTGDDH